MKNLRLAVLALLVACGGSKLFIAKDRADAVKKIAVVQYAINPHVLLGPAAKEEAKLDVAARNLETFQKELGNTYEIVPHEAMLANPAYATGKPEFEGYYSGKGMQYFSPDENALTEARLTEETAKKLCEALGVDGVVVVYDSWEVQYFAMDFRGHTLPRYTINLYDKTGARVWGGTVTGESSTEFPTPGRVPSIEVDQWTKANNESFTVALEQLKTSIGAR